MWRALDLSSKAQRVSSSALRQSVKIAGIAAGVRAPRAREKAARARWLTLFRDPPITALSTVVANHFLVPIPQVARVDLARLSGYGRLLALVAFHEC